MRPLLLILAMACGGDKAGDTGDSEATAPSASSTAPPKETDRDSASGTTATGATTPTGSASDTGVTDTAPTDTASTDTGEGGTTTGTTTPSGPIGYSSREGTATAGLSGFEGEERWSVTTEDGSEVLCTIAYGLTATGPRDDCEPLGATCDWAHDLVRSDARVEVDVDGACLRVLGTDAATVSDLDGTPVAYGYGLLAGHADVLLTDAEDGRGWRPDGFASWDPTTDAFSWTSTVTVVDL